MNLQGSQRVCILIGLVKMGLLIFKIPPMLIEYIILYVGKLQKWQGGDINCCKETKITARPNNIPFNSSLTSRLPNQLVQRMKRWRSYQREKLKICPSFEDPSLTRSLEKSSRKFRSRFVEICRSQCRHRRRLSNAILPTRTSSMSPGSQVDNHFI